MAKKNFFRLPQTAGTLAMVLVLGMMFVGCKTDDGADEPSLIATSGKLTVTGLSTDYNGKFFYAYGGIIAGNAYSATNISGVEIKDGKVDLRVYDGETVAAYSGSGSETLNIAIVSSGGNIMDNAQTPGFFIATGSSSVTFTNGVGTLENSAITWQGGE